MLHEHPMIERDSCRARLVRLGTSSLDLEIFAYVQTSVHTTFLEVQEDLLLRILDIVEASGTALAIPTFATYQTRDPGLAKEKT
jgi:MscS family membrane protein